MALKSRQWFFGKCYKQVTEFGPLAHLAHRALLLGFGKDRTQGHVLQACGAAQRFLTDNAKHKAAIRKADPVSPLEMNAAALRDWKRYFRSKSGSYHKGFGYNWSTLRGYLTKKYAGRRTGGGGGNNEFAIVLRLMAAFL